VITCVQDVQVMQVEMIWDPDFIQLEISVEATGFSRIGKRGAAQNLGRRPYAAFGNSTGDQHWKRIFAFE
jgi:hypothetical protein